MRAPAPDVLRIGIPVPEQNVRRGRSHLKAHQVSDVRDDLAELPTRVLNHSPPNDGFPLQLTPEFYTQPLDPPLRSSQQHRLACDPQGRTPDYPDKPRIIEELDASATLVLLVLCPSVNALTAAKSVPRPNPGIAFRLLWKAPAPNPGKAPRLTASSHTESQPHTTIVVPKYPLCPTHAE